MSAADDALAAASAATAAGIAAAVLGEVTGQTVYLLTKQMVSQANGGALAIPLLGMSAAGITAGFAAYMTVLANSQVQTLRVQSLMAEATQKARLP